MKVTTWMYDDGVCGGTSRVMTKVYDATSRMTEVGGGASLMMKVCGNY